MNKADIVDVLEDIAVLLELKGENPFKIRAYSTGARALETMEDDLGELIGSGKLSGMRGIGSALVEKIETLHATGELPYYTELRASVAPGLIEMLDIPGLGGKKVKKLHDALGVESIDALKAACESYFDNSRPKGPSIRNHIDIACANIRQAIVVFLYRLI